jgi:hypothetical protein
MRRVWQLSYEGSFPCSCARMRGSFWIWWPLRDSRLWELTPPEARKKVIELTRMVECEEVIGKIEDRHCQGQRGRFPTAFTRPWQLTTSRQVA